MKCVHLHSPSGQSDIRVSVHKNFQVHQIHKLLVGEGQDPLKYDHVSAIHRFLVAHTQEKEIITEEPLLPPLKVTFIRLELTLAKPVQSSNCW